MENRMKKYEQIRRQIENTRNIYSQIGEPLSADVIIDLYQHLGKALSMAQPESQRGRRPARKRQGMKS